MILCVKANKLVAFSILTLMLMSCHKVNNQDVSSYSDIRNIVPSEEHVNVLVAAHRSCWRMAPENSLEAMDKCIEIGVDMLEIDVRKSKDGQMVVIHDETVDRTTMHTGNVSDFTMLELSGFRLKEGAGGAGAPLTEQTIPSLEKVLQHLRGRVLINLDAKESIRNDVVAVIEKLGVNKQIVLKAVAGSPDDPVLASATYLDKIDFMPILRTKNGELENQVDSFVKLDPVAFEVIYESEDQLKKACHAAQQQAARCWVNTMWESLAPGHSDDVAILDPDAHWGHLTRLGVNMFQTDRPVALIKYLESQGLR